MKLLRLCVSFLFLSLCFSPAAWCGDSASCPKKTPLPKKSGCPVHAVSGTTAKAAVARSAAESPAADTLVIVARLIEIPGKFAPNDLYNYVYIMKYRVMKVVKGSYEGQEILVGHYNPLIPRQRIRDKMAPLARGNVSKFETGAKHALTLITPLERVWNDAVEDDYVDSDHDKYYALAADVAP